MVNDITRPSLEYAAVVWSPHAKDIDKLERAAIRWAPPLRDMNYEDLEEGKELT